MEHERIQHIIEHILSAMGVSGTVEAIPEEAIKGTRFHITTDESPLLIGNQGANLAALSHLVRKIIERRLGEAAKHGFILDVDNYQGKRIAELKDLAQEAAERVRHFKIDEELDPMPPYERMIIHTVLAEKENIKTESIGEGKTRRIIVRFAEA